MLTVGADVGKYRTKIKWKGGTQGHLSSISTYREIKDNVRLDDNNIVIEFNKQKYFAADLAEREGQNYFNSPEIHKSNLVTLLNLMIELSKLPDHNFNIVIGNPFSINIQSERDKLKSLLIGSKEFNINGRDFRIHIDNVAVAPEGLAAFYSTTFPDDVNIWDFGSSTIHAIAIRKRKIVDKRSHTFDFGFETLIDDNQEGIMQSLFNKMEKKWNDGNKKIICIGGKAPEMYRHVMACYPDSNAIMHNNHEYANAMGLYEMGVVAYERANQSTS